MKLKPLTCFIVFFLFYELAIGQNNGPVFGKDDKKVVGYKKSVVDTTSAFYIRGKILPGTPFEDWWLVNATLGFEYKFNKHHSIGIDYIFMKQWFERDLWDTVKNEELTYGYYSKNLRHSLAVDYRYYITHRWLSRPSFLPYISLLAKYGTARTWNQQGYIFKDDDIVNQNEVFYDLGAQLGVRIGDRTEGLYGVDISLGAVKRHRTQNIELYVNNGPNWRFENDKESYWLPVMRLNVFYRLR